MDLSNILDIISKIAKSSHISKPYLVGGMPRDYAMGNSSKARTTDVDITTNSADATRLGILFADHIDKNFRLFNKGNVKVMLDDYSMDFSSNFISDNVVNFFKSESCDEYKCPAFPDIEDELMEVYSRDFTINTLHQDIETSEVIDLIDRGLNDLKNKVIRTPVPAEITISDDPRRIYRAIYFSSKYDFKISEEIVSFVKNNRGLVLDDSITDTFITSKINEAIKYNPSNTIGYLNKMGILGKTPLVGTFKDYIIQNKRMLEYLDDEQNYRIAR